MIEPRLCLVWLTMDELNFLCNYFDLYITSCYSNNKTGEMEDCIIK